MFGIFKRRNQNPHSRSVSVRKIHTNDCFSRSSSLFENCAPDDYIPYPEMEEATLKAELDRDLADLKSGNIDPGNRDVETNRITSSLRKAIASYRMQRLEHEKDIRRFGNQFKTDKFDIDNMLSDAEAELKILEQEYEKVCHKISVAGD